MKLHLYATWQPESAFPNHSMASIFAKLPRTACQKSDLLLILILYYVMTGHDRLIYVIIARDLFDSMCLHFSFDLPMTLTYSET